MSTILLVDDDVHLRELSRIFLQQEGFTLAEASDGVEALAVFAQSKIDLVILDIMMPKMDGWKLCQELRRYSDVPILMLTARGKPARNSKVSRWVLMITWSSLLSHLNWLPGSRLC
nr:response regulator [Ktedonobacter racemifer]